MPTPPGPNGLKRGSALIASLWFLLLAGCPEPDAPPAGRFGGAAPGDVNLAVLVVDDPLLAAALEQLQGEWNAQTGSSYRVEQISWEELDAVSSVPADAVIGPPALLGTLAHKGGIVPIPKNYREEDRGIWPDLFSLLRSREAVWGKEVVGVPFGSPVLVIYCRADLLEKLDRQVPETWAGYLELAELLADRSALGDLAPPDGTPWCGAIEPLGPGSAGLVLLARAAPYASHRENYSTLFKIDTMEPLIAGVPFVRALEELASAAAWGSPEQLTYDPAAARDAFWQGRCGLALSWPSAAGDATGDDGQDLPLRLTELPGAEATYDIGEAAWEDHTDDEDPRVPLLGPAGRLGAVMRGSKWPVAAFQLLFWLSDEQSTQLCPASPATTLFRDSHLRTPEAWVEGQASAATAAEYAEMTRQTLSRPRWLFALRIPGRGRYLASLDDAVHRAVRKEQTPEESLGRAAAEWREITEELGSDSQREAYWMSLGLE